MLAGIQWVIRLVSLASWWIDWSPGWSVRRSGYGGQKCKVCREALHVVEV